MGVDLFFAETFLAGVFLSATFLAATFFAATFFAATFFAGAFLTNRRSFDFFRISFFWHTLIRKIFKATEIIRKNHIKLAFLKTF